MTVEGGKITAVDWNYVNGEGTLKSEDEGYQQAMTEKIGSGSERIYTAISEFID